MTQKSIRNSIIITVDFGFNTIRKIFCFPSKDQKKDWNSGEQIHHTSHVRIFKAYDEIIMDVLREMKLKGILLIIGTDFFF